MNVIEIKDLKKTFSRSQFTLSLPMLEVQEGYITGFIGENGAGKTTTIKLIMGMIRPDVGTVSVFGLDAEKDSARIKQMIGYVGEQGGFLDHMKLHLQVKMFAPFFDRWDAQRFEGYVKRFSLDLNKKYKELSKGKQKQFALAMALSHHPKLLLMDEPTANLDPLVRQELLEILSDEMQSEEMSIFFSTHITSDLDKIADYVQFVHSGKLLLSQDKDSLLESHRVVKARNELYTPEVQGCLIGGQQSSVGFAGLTHQPERMYRLLGEEAIYEKPTIEDIFLGYTKRGKGQ